MRAKSFFYVSLGILALAIAYHLGARTATAQSSGNPVVGMAASPHNVNEYEVVTASGDFYRTTGAGYPGTWELRGNVFSGATPVQQQSWGSVKARYRGERQPAAQGR